jgi:integrase/recombinase XerD
VTQPIAPPKRIYFGGRSKTPLPWTPMPFMEEYLLELENGEEPRSAEYLRPVKVGLSHFATFAATEDVRHPGEIKREHILRFQAYLNSITQQNGNPLSLAYRQQLMKYVRGWVNWLEDVRHIDSNPWFRIRIGRVAKLPKPLEPDEVASLFSAHRTQAFSIPPFSFHRREVILVLLFAWGLRIHELQALNVSNMDMRLDAVTVRNKGGGSKQEPYGVELKGVVQRWLSVRAKNADFAEDALVIDQGGNRLSIAMIRKIVTECGTRAGLSINPHRLRDTFGTTMLDHDVEVERIMKMMGHTQRAQTLAYSRVNDPKVLESHERVMGPLVNKLLSS